LTIDLPDSLLERARRHADLQWRTTVALMEDALRDYLERVAGESAVPPLPRWVGGGQLLVDLDDRQAP